MAAQAQPRRAILVHSRNVPQECPPGVEAVALLDREADGVCRRRSWLSECNLYCPWYELDSLYDEVRAPLIEAIRAAQGNLPDSLWWEGQIASRSTTAMPLVRHATYAILAREWLASSSANTVLIICADDGLLACMRETCTRMGFVVVQSGLGARTGRVLGRVFYKIAKIGAILLQAAIGFWRARKNHRITPEANEARPVALLRSWVTESALTSATSFADRHLGDLPAFLKDCGSRVLFLPMLFTGEDAGWRIARRLRELGIECVDPYAEISFADVLAQLRREWRRWRHIVPSAVAERVELAPLIQFEMGRQAFAPGLFYLNLIRPVLRRLAARGIRVDRIVYPFENNAPEKALLVAVREFQPQAMKIGYQHSVWLSRQLGAELIDSERLNHPLPNRIVCMGEIYPDILARLGFPPEMLVVGPGLRFASIRRHTNAQPPAAPAENEALRIFLPLVYEPMLVRHLIQTLANALATGVAAEVKLKRHPLLPVDVLKRILAEEGAVDWQVVEGSCDEWNQWSHVVVGNGTSVTLLEAVASRRAVVRLRPQCDFFLDPMRWMDYPIAPVDTADALAAALKSASALSPEILEQFAVEVAARYVNSAEEAQMEAFLVSKHALVP